ncbi:MAG: hypothetical protein JNM25_08275 [Planctomycetes bacterium]|nr:hypothetical protein [Planctomycetota bacterium]
MILARLSLPLLLGAALVAQQTSAEPAVAANRFVPADSCLVVRMAAPAKWQQQFAKTQVMKLLQAKTLAPLLEQMRAGDEAMLEQLRSDGFDADLVEKLLHDYTGDLIVSLQIDWDDLAAAMGEGRTPAMSIVVALTPGAGLDLAALATEIGKATERETENRRALRDVTVGDLRLRVTADADQIQANVPAMVDGHLVMVMVFGGDFEPAATRLLGAADRYQGEIGTQPLSVHGKLAPMMAKMLPALADEADANGAPFDVGALLQSLGLGALDTFAMSVAADDQHATAEFALTLGDADPGIFGAMLVDEQPRLLSLVPPTNDWFSVGHVDWNAIYGTLTQLWDELADLVPMSREDAEGAFADAMKVRLREDLFAHLGTEMLSLQAYDPNAADEDLDEDPMSALGQLCFVVALRNGKAFGESLETALRARGLHASRKTEEYAGTKVYLLRLAGLLEVEYAVTDDLLLIAPGKGEGGRRNLRAVLDARQHGAAGEPPTVLQAHLKELPAGWTGVSVAPVAAMLDNFRTGFAAAAASDEFPMDLDEVTAVLEGLAGDVQRLGIEHLISTTYTTKRSLKARLRW